MISILIPVYNFNIVPLIHQLHNQCIESNHPFEILILDDYSQEIFKEINRPISKIENVVYTELEQNIGRSKIRNLLAKKAKYSYCLFIDCDSEIYSDNYINKYLEYCKENIVVYGGTKYTDLPPDNKELLLHWTLGKNREEIPSKSLYTQNSNYFSTNNFLISKKLFETIQFDESLRRYGHEDTLFKIELKNRNIPIVYINNELIHSGLEPASVFLNKTKNGVRNLKIIMQSMHDISALEQNILLLRYYCKIERFKLVFIFRFLFMLFEKRLVKNLMSNNPNLRLFDLYKLCYICSLPACSD
jgi:glycosyltransferase involved in cell wall biosynthesis